MVNEGVVIVYLVRYRRMGRCTLSWRLNVIRSFPENESLFARNFMPKCRQIECSKNRSALTIFSICRKVDSWRVVKCATCSRCRRQSNACKQLPVQVIISIQLGSHKTARIALCLSWFPVFYCCCRVTQVRTRSFKAFDCCTDVQTRWYCLTL